MAEGSEVRQVWSPVALASAQFEMHTAWAQFRSVLEKILCII